MARATSRGAGWRLRGAIRRGLVGSRKRPDQRSRRRSPCAPSPRPEARADCANGFGSRSGSTEPCPDPEFAAFQKALGIEASVARGPHVLLLHQHSQAEANERIEMLESVIVGFHLLFAAEGIELATATPAPGFRLVCRQEGFSGLSARGGGRRVRDDARLFPSDLGRGGRVRREEHRSRTQRQGKAGCKARRAASIRPAVGRGARPGEDPDRAGRRASSHGWPFRGESCDRPARG